MRIYQYAHFTEDGMKRNVLFLILALPLLFLNKVYADSKLSGGMDFSAIVDSGGSVWMCGANYFGQSGGVSGDTTVPQQTDYSDVANIDCGDSHTMAVKSDGTLYKWGYNYHGQLGDSTIQNGVSDVACGSYHSLVLKTDGTLGQAVIMLTDNLAQALHRN